MTVRDIIKTMGFTEYIISERKPEVPETFLLRVKPKNPEKIFHFKPGQYCHIKNPLYEKPSDIHTFSIASSPGTKNYLEFCIKVYGNWTKTLSQAKTGDILQIEGPFGKFIWNDQTDTHAVFLVGGIGISPIMSMLHSINEKNYTGNFLLIYGNRTQDTIAYQKELEKFTQQIQKFRIVHIFSHLAPSDPWQGYRGFVTADVLQKEVDFSIQPTFFIIGPPIFIDKMNALLKNFSVAKNKIKQELIA